ncbi:bifunctional DNA primase/polymerase [Gimesia panareensis]|uniref:bifunctional DNA primase/polymerase n=1 Tax=Gimesia panareensis TaxID=2527978 RepID=UPI0018D9D673|nr:bifunctional DNA primase/polymerase [Gimesia panareensis]
MRYLEWGWQPIPLIGKQPPKSFPLKLLFQMNTPSMERLLPWLPPCHSGNIGIITGELSDLVVVDYDSKDAIAFGEQLFMPTPFSVKTGNSGRHDYYRYPSGAVINCRLGLYDQEINLQANNGFVVSPPSLHPKTGFTYRWEIPLSELSLSDMPIFNPTWLPPLLKRTVRKTSHQYVRTGNSAQDS